jgi:hypothetical protein
MFSADTAAAATGTIAGVFAAQPTARGAFAIREVLTTVPATQRAAAIGRVVSAELVEPDCIGVRVEAFEAGSKWRHFDVSSLARGCCRKMNVSRLKFIRSI